MTVGLSDFVRMAQTLPKPRFKCGHEMTPENSRTASKKKNTKRCRQCVIDYRRRYRAERKQS